MSTSKVSAYQSAQAKARASFQRNVVKLYESGWSIERIATKWGCSDAPVRRALIEAKVPIRSQGRPASPKRKAKARA